MKRLVLGFALLGCSACSDVPASTIAGTVDTASFSGAANRIRATDSQGVDTVGVIQSDGKFSLSLASHETYRLYLEVDGTSVPVATRTSDAGFGSVVAIGSDAAAVDMGLLRYSSLAATRDAIVGLPVADTCVDGVGSSSGDACVGTEAAVDCSAADSMGHGDHDGDHDGDEDGDHDGGHHHGDHDGDGDHGMTVTDTIIDGVDGVALPVNALPISVSCGMVGGC